MAQKPDRSRRRRPRKGFPFRIVGYLDRPSLDLVGKAAERANESISTFVAKAVLDRAETILKAPKPK